MTFPVLQQKSKEEILNLIEGRVFHVTKEENWIKILDSGELQPNKEYRFTSSFGSSNRSFFRQRGCISLFDWRDFPTVEIADFRYRCWPFQPAVPGGDGVVFMVARETIYNSLISWNRWKEEEAWGEMIVPYVETGFPGHIPLKNFSEFILYKKESDAHGSLESIVSASFYAS